MRLSLSECIRWLTFGVLLLITAPAQAFLQASYYSMIGEPGLRRDVITALYTSFCLLEAVALTLIANAFKRGDWARALLFCATLPFIMGATFSADLGSISVQFEAAQRDQGAQIEVWTQNKQKLREAEAALTAMAQSIPAAYRGKPATALSAELRGVKRRLGAYAVPPRGLMGKQAAIESALATVQAIDAQKKQIAALRVITAKPKPDPLPPQTAFLNRAATMLQIAISPDNLNALLGVCLVAIAKLATITGFGITTPKSGPAIRSARTPQPAPPQHSPSAAQGAAPAARTNPRKAAPGIAHALSAAFRFGGKGGGNP